MGWLQNSNEQKSGWNRRLLIADSLCSRDRQFYSCNNKVNEILRCCCGCLCLVWVSYRHWRNALPGHSWSKYFLPLLVLEKNHDTWVCRVLCICSLSRCQDNWWICDQAHCTWNKRCFLSYWMGRGSLFFQVSNSLEKRTKKYFAERRIVHGFDWNCLDSDDLQAGKDKVCIMGACKTSEVLGLKWGYPILGTTGKQSPHTPQPLVVRKSIHI